MSLMKVVKNLGSRKRFQVDFTERPEETTIARIVDANDGDIVGFATMHEGESEQKGLSIDSEEYDIEPMVPIDGSWFVWIISGESDSGKSTTGALLLDQYSRAYPQNGMFLISQKNKNVDRNLSKIARLQQLNENDIMDFDINNFSNCLFLIDDSDFGKVAKKVFEVLNLISTVGREYNISLIFITHFNSRLNASLVYKEFQYYMTFHNNLVNNRMLYQNLGLSKHTVEELIDRKRSFYLWNRKYRTLTTDSEIEKY